MRYDELSRGGSAYGVIRAIVAGQCSQGKAAGMSISGSKNSPLLALYFDPAEITQGYMAVPNDLLEFRLSNG
ncbi:MULTISPECIES: hypothetical protein [Nitrosomonas]|uniref:hypothetical protein n=1 Tax=Nitrosomonas TaxID=914 RepID=UPI0002E716D5|nr:MULTISPECIES: hypothetical protein [Nitrosomonas]